MGTLCLVEIRQLATRRLLRYGWVGLIGLALLVTACGGEQGEDQAEEAQSPPDSNDNAAQVEELASVAPTATLVPECTPASRTYIALPILLESGMVSVTSVDPLGMGILGRGVMTVNILNETDQEVCLSLPPGYIFLPPTEGGEQRMMVIDGETIIIPPSGTVALDPYLTCIDATKSAPGEGSAYTAGGMVEDDDLRLLAECLDSLELPDISYSDTTEFIAIDLEAYSDLQSTVWAVSNPITDLGELEDLDLTDEELAELAALQQFSEGTQAWLDLCGVKSDG